MNTNTIAIDDKHLQAVTGGGFAGGANEIAEALKKAHEVQTQGGNADAVIAALLWS